MFNDKKMLNQFILMNNDKKMINHFLHRIKKTKLNYFSIQTFKSYEIAI